MTCNENEGLQQELASVLRKEAKVAVCGASLVVGDQHGVKGGGF